VTSLAADCPVPDELSGATIATIPAEATTTFTLEEGPDGRTLTLVARASTLSSRDVPEAWRAPELLHLAPIAWEVDPGMATQARAGSMVATLQGWLRRSTRDGIIIPAIEQIDDVPLESLTAVVTSMEDLGGDHATAAAIAARCPITVVTRGAQGCTLYTDGRPTPVPAWPVQERDSTGAGDVFATAFFIRLGESGDPVRSAEFAARVAALSVEGIGVSCIPTRGQLEEREWRA
jgi:sugar/nucleoside kinase (ribokinase family)